MSEQKRKYVPSIRIENAHIFWKHFSGEQDDFHRQGERDFNVTIPEDMAPALIDDGWDVKSNVREDGSMSYRLKVKVGYKAGEPAIFTYTGRKRTALHETTIGILDSADIQNVDLVIKPSFWGPIGDKSGIAAYVTEMHVTVAENAFAEKYAAYDDPDELPFR